MLDSRSRALLLGLLGLALATGCDASNQGPRKEPFDVMADTGASATVTGDRAVRVELPKAMIDSLASRCASRKLSLKLTMDAQYATACTALTGDGLPYHNLAVDLTLAADGKHTVEGVTGSSYLEG